jgi:hypothetical protein
VDDKKPDSGPEAEIIARLRAMTEEMRRLRRDFDSQRKPHRMGASNASDHRRPVKGRTKRED